MSNLWNPNVSGSGGSGFYMGIGKTTATGSAWDAEFQASLQRQASLQQMAQQAQLQQQISTQQHDTRILDIQVRLAIAEATIERLTNELIKIAKRGI